MPTKKQLSKMREAENEYPGIRRKDDPLYKDPIDSLNFKVRDLEKDPMSPEEFEKGIKDLGKMYAESQARKYIDPDHFNEPVGI